MGNYRGVYIGIYLEVQGKNVTIQEKKYRDPITKKLQKNRFDQNTGVENLIEYVDVVKFVEPSPYIEEEGYDEDLFTKPAYCDDLVFILNRGTKYSNYIDEVETFEIVNDIPKLIESFKVKYKKYLDYYSTSIEFEVKYGVVSYVN